MKRITAWLLCALLLGALCACTSSPSGPEGALVRPLAVTAYYVDSVGGNDSLAGTSTSTAWKTIAKLNSRSFAPGDTINLRRGSVFSGTVLTIQQDGTSSAPITVSNYGTGNLPVLKNPNQLYALEIKGDWVVVDGVSMQDTTKIASWPAGYADSGAILVRTGADNVTIKNSEFTNVGLGVKTYGLATTITGNNFHDLVIAYTDSFQSYGAVGVSLNNSNAVVSYNTFTNCRSTNSPYGADGGALEIEGLVHDKNNIVIHHNKSVGSEGFLEVTETSTSNVTLSYNLSDDYLHFIAFDTTTRPTNYRAEHNTVIRTRSANAVNVFAVFYYREVVATPNDSWLTIRNNIFYSPAAKILRGTYTYTDYNFPHDHNLYLQNGTDPVGYPLGVGDIVADPKFVSNFGDLRLTASSPAINAGVNLGYSSDFAGNPVPSGSAPDMGAYEFQGSTSSTGNLLTDPGFENQSSDTLQSPWIKEGNDSAGVDRAQNKSRSGANNGWIASNGTGWNAIKQQVSVQANTSYRLSVWVRNSGNLAAGAGYFGVKTTGGAVVQEISHGSAGSYTQLSLDFNSGPNTTLVVHSGYYGPGTASWEQIDDWSLTATTTSTAASVTNPSYEASGGLTTPWFTESTGTDGFFGLDAGTGLAQSGVNNAWIATSGSNWNAIKQQLSVQPNTNYTLSVWVQNSGNFTGGYFGVKTTGGSVVSEIQHGAATAYTQLSVSFNSGSNSTVVIHAGYWGTGAATWERIDNWSLVTP